jgi:hypothetical protein
VEPDGLLDDLHGSEVGDALPVRQAATAQDPRPVPDGRGELLDESGLADAGVAEHGDEMAPSLDERGIQVFQEVPKLLVPADHRRAEARGMRRRAAENFGQPVGRNRLGFALQLERFHGLHDYRVPH